MSDSNFLLIAPSPEFVSLARAQIALLTQGLKADWSAVYLTERGMNGTEADLIPVVVYPQTDTHWQDETHLTLPPQRWSQKEAIPALLTTPLPQSSKPSNHTTEIDRFTSLWTDAEAQKRHQLVLPLIYEDRMMGLLVTGRYDRAWNAEELAQIEKIAKTLAIARLLDRHQNQYQRQLSEQRTLRSRERDRLDDLLHQLRNPLTALRTFAKLLLKRLLPEDANQSVAKGILRESDRLGELLQAFEAEIDLTAPTLSLNSAQQSLPETTSPLLLPSQTLPLETLKIRDVLDPLLVSASAIAQERNIDLTANLPTDLPPVQGNAKALREVLNNLIDNGLKYTPSGGEVDIEIKTKTATTTGNWQGIVIRDTGYGIPPQDREHIFERHYRGVQAQGDIAGSGLGLAIVKDLVEQMQGKIELISPNLSNQTHTLPGTTFIVWLPV